MDFRQSLLFALFLVFGQGAQAQTLVSTGGSSAGISGGSVSWSVGETVIGTGNVPSGIVTQGFEQPIGLKVQLNIAAILQGPYNSVSGLMYDSLRSMPDFPLSEPFTALGYGHVDGGGESTTAPVLAVSGNDAIVDWILVELRDALDPTMIIATRSALLQRDGDIVDVDGTSPVEFDLSPDDYHIAVLHRNHLGVMTASAITLGDAVNTLDLTAAGTPTYGTNARVTVGTVEALWAGDSSFDGIQKYTGANNDRDPILQAIGGVIPTNTVSEYRGEDINMDGVVKYTGLQNDRDIILQTIGGTVPTNTKLEQIP